MRIELTKNKSYIQSFFALNFKLSIVLGLARLIISIPKYYFKVQIFKTKVHYDYYDLTHHQPGTNY